MHVTDPQRLGLVTKIARPSGNITGFARGPQITAGKCIELLVELLGKAKRIGYVGNPDSRNHEAEWQDGLSSAQRLGIALEHQAVRQPSDIERVMAALEGADGVFVEIDFMLASHRPRIATAALKHRLPSVFESRPYVVEGGLMSFGANLRQNFRRGAGYVDRILKGVNPSSLPVDQNSTFELVINLKTARAPGLTVPPILLAQADEVIE